MRKVTELLINMNVDLFVMREMENMIHLYVPISEYRRFHKAPYSSKLSKYKKNSNLIVLVKSL